MFSFRVYEIFGKFEALNFNRVSLKKMHIFQLAANETQIVIILYP